MPWSLITLIINWWTSVTSGARKSPTSANHCTIMPWTKNLATLINTTSMLHLVTTPMAAQPRLLLDNRPCAYPISLTITRYIPIIYPVHSLWQVISLKKITLFFFGLFRGSYRGMILVRRNMQKFTITGQMYRKLCMQIQLGFHTNGLLAGKIIRLMKLNPSNWWWAPF